MILIDANILLYAEDRGNPQHKKIVSWWDQLLSGTDTVNLCWPVIMAFIRISTNRRVFTTPLSIDEAMKRVQSWLNQPCVNIIQPTSKHWMILKEVLKKGQAIANLSMDAHIATLAIEHGCTLYSTDKDFSRFKSLKWKNPLD